MQAPVYVLAKGGGAAGPDVSDGAIGIIRTLYLDLHGIMDDQPSTKIPLQQADTERKKVAFLPTVSQPHAKNIIIW